MWHRAHSEIYGSHIFDIEIWHFRKKGRANGSKCAPALAHIHKTFTFNIRVCSEIYFLGIASEFISKDVGIIWNCARLSRSLPLYSYRFAYNFVLFHFGFFSCLHSNKKGKLTTTTRTMKKKKLRKHIPFVRRALNAHTQS